MSVGRVVAAGARASLGLHAVQVAMGVRARLYEPRASRLEDARGLSIGTCRVGGVGADVHGLPRMLALAAPALAEATAGQDLAGCALVLVAPPAGREDDEEGFDELAHEVARRAGVRFAELVLVRGGSASGVEALRVAQERLEAGASGVVVGGVDSYYHPDVLRRLDRDLRLHARGIEDGFTPGEGAAFILLRPQPSEGDLASLGGVAVARDEAILDPSKPLLAQGLTAAIRALEVEATDWVMTDVNSEHVRVREWSLVSVRRRLGGGTVTRLVAELGDLGAASVPMMAAVASCWWELGCAPSEEVLLLASSEDDARGAVLLRAVA